ncbi:MAG: hypothetical protein ABTQ32_24205 [Myxococcaceae bacterium]
MTPLFTTPPTLEHRTGLVKVWLFDAQATMVDQVLAPSLSDEVAAFLTRPASSRRLASGSSSGAARRSRTRPT